MMSGLRWLPHVIVTALIRIRMTILCLPYRLPKIIGGVRNAIPSSIDAVLRVVAITRALAVLLLLVSVV